MQLRPLLVALVAGVAATACSSDRVLSDSPFIDSPTASLNSSSTLADDPAVVSPVLAQLDAKLAAAGSNLRIAKAEFIVDTANYRASSQTLIASDRARGIGSEWVAGDPRRNGRIGLSYAFDPLQGFAPFTRNPDGSGLRQLTFPELEPYLEEGMTAWRSQSCSAAPVERVALPAGLDPDFIDQLFLGADGGRPYAQVSDIVQGGWQNPAFFTTFAGPSGNNIIGVAFTLWFVDASGTPTDIDGDGNNDTGLSEIYYNSRYAWGASGAANVVDLYSIITHETGHAVGLGHFGKVFVTKRDAGDGISVADIKYSPKAMMNAVYVTGRSEIAGTDNSSFCQIWGAKR